MDLQDLLRRRVEAFEERKRVIEAEVEQPGRAGKSGYGELLRELGAIGKVLDPWARWVKVRASLAEARELVDGTDAEMAGLAEEEIPGLEREDAALEAGLLDRLLEEDPDANRPAIVEIRAGTGGEEAALFAADLARIYQRYAALQGWKVEVMDSNPSEMGGLREMVFKLSGDDVFRFMRWESGGHRVQRVPATETQGRIHTSAATVAVMPEAEAVDIELKPEDLEITAMRAGGPGGQSVNKTESAVRVVHIPTGLMVKCQEDKSQLRNRERALQLLRSRLYERERQKREDARRDLRRTQVGSGDRSERIRTYNWPQNRVSDHRINQNFSLEKVLEGNLDDLFAALLAADREAKLASL
ncbi:MAG: peptide chain release factor 1 [Planctomycetota bacterium]|nr:peptide chain release factor 1 [Planctomycetota bacterium]